MRGKRNTEQQKPAVWHRGADVPMRVIRRFARQVVERFAPEQIILFGSHAYGTPHADSDVDILVVMPCRNQLDQAFKIHSTLMPPFPLDIIVCKPRDMIWRLAEGDSFLSAIIGKGIVLHEADDAGVGAEGRGRLRRHRQTRARA